MASAVAADRVIYLSYNKSYTEEIESDTLEVVASGSTIQAGTLPYNRSGYKTVISGAVYEYYYNEVVNSEYNCQYIDINDYVSGVVIPRNPSNPFYKYKHVGARYGVSNPDYANSSSLAEDLSVEVYQMQIAP